MIVPTGSRRAVRVWVTDDPDPYTGSDWPFVVEHDINYNDPRWAAMSEWLTEQVGAIQESWTWVFSNRIRFKTESDAIRFSLSWT